MTVTIDRAGRLVIPREIRREAGLEPGAPLDIRLRDGVVEIEPKAMQVRLERRGRLVVAVPVKNVPPLTSATVERTRQAIYAGRARHSNAVSCRNPRWRCSTRPLIPGFSASLPAPASAADAPTTG